VTQPIKPRPLNIEERTLMEFLLSAEFPGRDKLRSQLDSVAVVAVCECGCGTVNLQVGSNDVQSSAEALVPIEAHGDLVDVLLFTRRGCLSSLELVFPNERLPRRFPKPSDLQLWVRPPRNP
jgi:hypothetical protein